MLEKYPEILTPSHIMEILNLSKNTVYDMLKMVLFLLTG